MSWKSRVCQRRAVTVKEWKHPAAGVASSSAPLESDSLHVDLTAAVVALDFIHFAWMRPRQQSCDTRRTHGPTTNAQRGSQRPQPTGRSLSMSERVACLWWVLRPCRAARQSLSLCRVSSSMKQPPTQLSSAACLRLHDFLQLISLASSYCCTARSHHSTAWNTGGRVWSTMPSWSRSAMCQS